MTIPSMKAKNGSFSPKEKTSISFDTLPKHLQVTFIQITRYWDNAVKIFICTSDQKCLKTMWITKNLDIFLRIYAELSQPICKPNYKSFRQPICFQMAKISKTMKMGG